jgi:hypothetical protein
VGTFRIGLHPLHPLHYFLLLRERGILIDHHHLADAPTGSSPRTIKTVNLTITKPQSRVRLIYGIPRGWGGTCRGQTVDQITDHSTPYCNEPSAAVTNKTWVLAER